MKGFYCAIKSILLKGMLGLMVFGMVFFTAGNESSAAQGGLAETDRRAADTCNAGALEENKLEEAVMEVVYAVRSMVHLYGRAGYPYEIHINKKMNCVTVYAIDSNGEYTIPVQAFVCSVGEATPVGTFRTPAKYRWRLLFGNVWGQYSTRITGSILFHSVPYASQRNDTLISRYYNQLGDTASAGCVRLTTIDAKWIYDNCPVGTTVVIYNDDNPGPLGKPVAMKVPLDNGWDPTDPDPSNPWRDQMVFDDQTGRYFTNGKADTSFTGLRQGGSNWYYVANGAVDWNYTGLYFHDGVWKYVDHGMVDFNYTGLYFHDGVWKYVNHGVADSSYTGFCQYQEDWWYVKNGQVDFKATGPMQHSGGWWYVKNGQVDFKATGLCQHNGGWWYVKNGQVDFQFTGLCQHNGDWWYVRNGQVDFRATGLCQHNGNWWYVRNGQVDFKATGLCQYNGNWWYVRNGQVDFQYNGWVPYGNTFYNVVNGCVVF